MRTNVRMSAIACMAWAWLTPASLRGQSYTASLRGTVTGPTGGVVPGSQVTLVNEGTNARQVKSANERGAYLFTLLPPDGYKLTVESAGFWIFICSGMQSQVQQQTTADVMM